MLALNNPSGVEPPNLSWVQKLYNNQIMAVKAVNIGITFFF